MKKIYLLLIYLVTCLIGYSQTGTTYVDFTSLNGGPDGKDASYGILASNGDVVTSISVQMISEDWSYDPYIIDIITPSGVTYSLGPTYNAGGVTFSSGAISEPGGSVWMINVYETGSATGSLARVQVDYTYVSPPVANDDGPYIVNTGGIVVGNVLTNDTDGDGDDLDVVSLPTLSQGSFNSFDLETGAFVYQAPINWVGSFTFDYTVTDGKSNDAGTATIEVKDTIVPMVITKDTILYLNSSGEAILSASDLDIGSSDNIGIDLLELEQTSFGCADVGDKSILLTATDAAGNSESSIAKVSISDTISPLVNCQDITVYLDATGNATIAEDSIDNGSTDACGGLIFDTDKTEFGSSDVGDNIIALTVTDKNGNFNQCISNVMVLDTFPPVIKTNPIKIVLWETGEYVLNDSDLKELTKGTIDNHTVFDDIKIVAFPRTFECIHVGDSVPVKVTVTDMSGNTSSAWTKVMVYDETAPVAECQDLQVVLDENGEATILPGMINKGYTGGSNPGWVRTRNNLNEGNYNVCGIETASLDKYQFNCSDIGENVVTLTVTDPSNNSSSCEAVVTVVDTLPPQIAPVEDITIELPAGICETAIDYPQLTVIDNCDVVWEQTSGLGADTLFPIGVTTETWTATDAGGNTAEVSFMVTVTTRNAQPTLDAVEDVVAEEDSNPVTVPLTGISYGMDCEPQTVIVTATDTNQELITVTLNYTDGETGSLELSIAPEMSGTAEVEVTVEDEQGGTTSETFMVTVNPINDAPFLVNPITDQVVNASYVLKIPVSQTLGDIFDDTDDDVLNFVVMQENGEPVPSWTTILNDTLVATPLIADTGCVSLVIMATDAAGASVSDTFSVCVDGYPVSSPEIENSLQVNVYPNPTKGRLNLNLNTVQYHEMEVLVTNIAGKEILRKTYQNKKKVQFDLSQQVSGIYLVLIKIDEAQFMKKIILNK